MHLQSGSMQYAIKYKDITVLGARKYCTYVINLKQKILTDRPL